MAFDPKWPYGHITRNGLRARVICEDAAGKYPIIALLPVAVTGGEAPHIFQPNGRHRVESALDLRNAPDPNEPRRWVNIYKNGMMCHRSREDACLYEGLGILGCRHIAYRDGKIVDITDEEA